jgi:hypothetical protein
MKKVSLASLLACAVLASNLPSTSYAQAAPAAAAQPGAAAACPPMADTEYKPYTDAMGQTAPAAKAAAIEAYLTAFPQSCVKLPTMEVLMMTYSALDPAKTIDTADRVLQLDPSNLRALTLATYFRKQSADSLTDPAAKQAPLDAAAGYAQKGLAATKPAAMSDADFKKLQDAAFPIFYSAIGAATLNKKDAASAIDAYKKELASVPVDQTTKPGPILQDTYYLALAYEQSTPPDLLDCAFYASRFVAYAPEPYKTQIAPTAKYCYRKYHGADDGYDAVVAAAQANLNPPASFASSVKPAPTPADIVNTVITTTPNLGTLAVGDKEFILQNGTPEQSAKVWDTIKGKSVQIPGALVIASTPTQLQVAISDDAVQSKTADFTFNMAPADTSTAAGKKKAEQIAAATTVGSTVALEGTYASFAPKPIMITMDDGAVVLKAAPKAPAPVHHAAARKK